MITSMIFGCCTKLICFDLWVIPSSFESEYAGLEDENKVLYGGLFLWSKSWAVFSPGTIFRPQKAERKRTSSPEAGCSTAASREEEISSRQFNFSLETVVGDRRPPTRRHPPPAAMDFAVVEGESFSPSCSTLVMV
jgi:hypothetical protein